MDSLGRIIEMLVTIVLIFLVPLYYMAYKQDLITQTYVTTETSYFVDSVRNLGYFTDSMYETFIEKLEDTNAIYKIELTHYKQMVHPVEEGNDYKAYYYNVYTQEILEKVFQQSSGGHSYKFQQGDYFLVRVENRNKTLAGKIQAMLFQRDLSGKQILVVYGGAIRDEAY